MCLVLKWALDVNKLCAWIFFFCTIENVNHEDKRIKKRNNKFSLQQNSMLCDGDFWVLKCKWFFIMLLSCCTVKHILHIQTFGSLIRFGINNQLKSVCWWPHDLPLSYCVKVSKKQVMCMYTKVLLIKCIHHTYFNLLS